jgi:hypothetical protein
MPTDAEIRNRRITAAVLLVAVAIAVLALTDTGPFADETEADRVREAVERFVAARDGRDFGVVCGVLTPTLRRQVEATSGAQPGSEPPTCAEVLDARERAEQGEETREVEVVDVSVSGNRARAAVEQQEGVSRSLTLERVDGEWLVATFER